MQLNDVLRPDIVRVFGTADSFDLEFFKKGDSWACFVPPDTSDGVFAVCLTAINEMGQKGFFVGELFITNGVCHLRLCPAKFRLELNFRRCGLNIYKGCGHNKNGHY